MQKKDEFRICTIHWLPAEKSKRVVNATIHTQFLCFSPIGHSTMAPRRSLSRNGSLEGGRISRQDMPEGRTSREVSLEGAHFSRDPSVEEKGISREQSVEERRLSRETSVEQSSAATDDFFLLNETAKTNASRVFHSPTRVNVSIPAMVAEE